MFEPQNPRCRLPQCLQQLVTSCPSQSRLFIFRFLLEPAGSEMVARANGLPQIMECRQVCFLKIFWKKQRRFFSSRLGEQHDLWLIARACTLTSTVCSMSSSSTHTCPLPFFKKKNPKHFLFFCLVSIIAIAVRVYIYSSRQTGEDRHIFATFVSSCQEFELLVSLLI